MPRLSTTDLRAAIARIARVPQLLVALRLRRHAGAARRRPDRRPAPLPEAVAAIRALASLPQTTVAVISGRALRDLAALSRLPSEVHLVGSHGSEFDVGFVQRLAPELVALRDPAARRAARDRRARTRASAWRRSRPASPCTSAAPTREVGERALEAVRCGPATWPDIHVTHGKDVDRAVACSRPTRARPSTRCAPSRRPAPCSSSATTSPTRTRSRSCTAPTSASRSAPGETPAAYRVDDPIDAVRVLGAPARDAPALALRRARGADRAALHARQRLDGGAAHARRARSPGSAIPGPDSAAVFADLLGGERGRALLGRAGRATGIPLGQRYRPGTMTVETRWSGLTVTDWLTACRRRRRAERARTARPSSAC